MGEKPASAPSRKRGGQDPPSTKKAPHQCEAFFNPETEGQLIFFTVFFSGAMEMRTVSPLLPGKPVNMASTRFGTT